MYKVAASCDDAAAEYDLGLMYFRGQGGPVDRARGTAWMILAAQGGNPLYVKARDLMVTALTDKQFAEADALWNRLKKTCDEVGLPKAGIALGTACMADVVGSHLGVQQAGQVFGGTIGSDGRLRIEPDAATFGRDALGPLSDQQLAGTHGTPVPDLLKCPGGSVEVGPFKQIST